MKCPNCGAETQSAVCEYCGSEMPKQQPNINVVNNYYGDIPQAEMNGNTTVGVCPKCGSTKINFKRERIGTTTKSQSRRRYVVNGSKGQAVSQSAYRTIGLCQNCGCTWNPDGGSKASSKSGAPMWLWVLGWICIFPIPLTVLMLRKKEMNPIVKYGIIVAAWIVYLMIALSGAASNTDTSVEADAANATEAVGANNEAEPTDRDLGNADSDEISVEEYIDDIVSKYNSKVEEKLAYTEDFTPSDKEGTHYRTEFRLGAWNDAVGKSYSLGDSVVDIVAVNGITKEIDFRVYSYCTLEQASLLVNGIAPLLDEDLSASDLSDAINTIKNDKSANGYYFGNLELLLLEKGQDSYEFMLKLE